jgi:hypothetical protein
MTDATRAAHAWTRRRIGSARSPISSRCRVTFRRRRIIRSSSALAEHGPHAVVCPGRSAIQAGMSSRPRTNSGSGKCARTSCVKSRQYRSERTALSVASKSRARASSRAPIPDRPHAYETRKSSPWWERAPRIPSRSTQTCRPTSRPRPGSGWPRRAAGPRGQRLRLCAGSLGARLSLLPAGCSRELMAPLRARSIGWPCQSARSASAWESRAARSARSNAAADVCPRAPQKKTSLAANA